jgi:hypothetical protein
VTRRQLARERPVMSKSSTVEASLTDEERAHVRARIEDGTVAVPWSGCWLWDRGVAGKGYGVFRVRQTQVYAHRMSAIVLAGLDVRNAVVMHKCDVPACCNPDHLAVGTMQDNHDDMWTKGRNVPTTRRGGFSDDVVRSIFRRRQNGELAASIARSLGVRRTRVERLLAGRRGSLRQLERLGLQPLYSDGRALLRKRSEADAAKAAELRASGLTWQAVGEQLGCSYQAAHALANRRPRR